MEEALSSPSHDEDIIIRPTVAYFSVVSTSEAWREGPLKMKTMVEQHARKKSKDGTSSHEAFVTSKGCSSCSSVGRGAHSFGTLGNPGSKPIHRGIYGDAKDSVQES
ncbi:hypothetical protein Fot_44600 [Forsythia ovata]|uniref:Uncharacterized protein n=1 Tax=Forsythia ovata TaxID=205694 RepID=A0ABD1R3Z5_9LAMI